MMADPHFPFLTTRQADRLRTETRAAFARRGVTTTAEGWRLRAGDWEYPLEALAHKCRRVEDEHWAAVIDEHVAALLSSSGGADDLDRDGLLATMYVRLLPDDFAPDPNAFRYPRPVAAGLVEALAVDLPDKVQVLDDDRVARVGLEAARAAGLRNLAALPIEDHEVAHTSDGTAIHLINGESMFVASMAVVLPELMRRTIGTEPPADGVFVAVPWRHNLAFHPIVDTSSVDALNALTNYAVGAYDDNPGSLSPRVYWWRNGTLTATTEIDDQAQTIAVVPPPDLIAVFDRLHA